MAANTTLAGVPMTADPSLEKLLETARRASRLGGDVLKSWAGRFAVREKGRADLVTEADLASQEAVYNAIMSEFPDHGFLGEEEGKSIEGRDGYRWIVDPLDGTTNYVHGLAQFAVSIGLERYGKPLVGAVYDPSADECFSAAAGLGAWVNDHRIRTSDVTELGQALVAVSFPPAVRRTDAAIDEFLTVMEATQAVRRMGSSALNLCYLAAGRIDAYWAKDTKTWDVAAGFLLVDEAGGTLTNYEGGPAELNRPKFVAAATPELHRELRRMLSGAAI
jgi:myo-inositol-1(or 4)-monophosphatase